MQNARNLHVTERARRLAILVYRATRTFGDGERFGLTTQMRRAAVSIGSNIAEGCGRQGNRALVPYLYVALGSASELEFQTQLAIDLELAEPNVLTDVLAKTQEIKRMLARLIKAIQARI